MSIGTIARRYAEALERHATQHGEAEAIYHHAEKWILYLRQVPALKEALSSPLRNEQEKYALLERLSEKKLEATMGNFLRLVLRHHREELLEWMLHAYRQCYREKRNLHEGELVVAAPLTDEEQERLSAWAKKWIGGEIEWQIREDPSLIGGFRLRVDDQLVDASLKRKLRRIKEHFGASEH